MLYLLSLVCALGGVTSHSTETGKVRVAFIAHFYPKSHYDDETFSVYLCGLHGEDRRVIPGDAGRWPVQWKDANHVVWLTASDPNSPDADLERIFDLRTGKTTTIHADKHGDLPDEVLSHELTFIEHTGNVDSLDSLNPRYPGKFSFGSDDRSFELRRKGVVKKFVMTDGDRSGMLMDKPNNRVWFYFRGHVSGEGTWNTLFHLDWRTGKAIKVFGNVNDFDLSPHRALYGAVENFHLPSWARTRWPHLAKAWVGNWKTGRKWPIVGSRVYVTSIALRP